MGKWAYEGYTTQVFKGFGLAFAKEDYEKHRVLFRNIGFIIGCLKFTFLWAKETQIKS